MINSHDEVAEGADPPFRYWAFISYSHRDVKWAQWLHTKLETYNVPPECVGRRLGSRTIPRRLTPIFRDRDELASAGDLSIKIREALQQSHALIVICSPYAATSPWVNEEVRAFKALGRSERVFPLIIEGEPYALDRPDLGEPECFPPALRFALAVDGTLTNRRSDPLAADAREGKDGRSNSCLKVIAGVLGVGFDDLRRRELVRRRQRQLISLVASVVALLLIGITYIGLADSDFNEPGGPAIRRMFDRYGVSIFRPIASREDVLWRASQLRTQLRQRLVRALVQKELTLKRDATDSIWTVGQIAAALYRDREATPDDIRLVAPMLDQIFQDDFPVKLNGRNIGWRGDGAVPRVDTTLWILMALAHALKREGDETEAFRDKFVGYLATAQGIAENYYPLHDGGWNVVIEDKAEEHSVYSSALALHALLELQSANLCWRGNCERLHAMIKETSGWLIQAFIDGKPLRGWRSSASDESPPNQELSLLVYGVLGRSRVQIPDNIRSAALRRLTDLRLQTYHPANREITHWVTFVNDRGQGDVVSMRTTINWYPWAAEALKEWLRYIDYYGYPAETKRALERSLGHVIIAESDEMLNDMSHAGLYAIAESSYGIGGLH
jgi:hypothetical protein